MAAKKPAKVANAEYVEPRKAKKDSGAWELGKPAPSTKYLDHSTGEVVDEAPVRSQVIVFEGDIVTEPILVKLGLAEPAATSGFIRS